MQIQVNTDNQIKGGAHLTKHVHAVVERALVRFSERITRVEVHLSDENSSAKYGDNDMRCLMEARLTGMQPVSVSHRDESLEQALDGAADKLEKTLKRTLSRLDNPRGRTAVSGGETD